jgi:chromatin segregation and condensation protein Rec8/ScpA/Scc1 (kleisin family)
MQAGFAASGKKKRRLSGGGAAVVEGALSADGLVEGKSRIDACRWFFELLVLKNKDYVDLAQAAPYADIRISQRPKLVAI